MMKKRMIKKPQDFSSSQMEGFFMLSNKDAAIAITNKLTGSQLRLWLYLMMIDPFADKSSNGEIIYHKLPSVAEISIQLGVNSGTIEKDLRVLKKLRLYSYRITELQGHNLSALNARQASENFKKKAKRQSQQGLGENNPQERLNNLFELENESQQGLGENNPQERLNNPQERLNNPQERLNNLFDACETIVKSTISASPQTIQTIQTDQTPPLPPQGEGEREGKSLQPEAEDIWADGKEVEQVSVSSQKSTSITLSKTEIILEDPFHRRCNMRRDKNTTQDLPDGPWMVEYKTPHGRVEKKLDINFIKYIADGWFRDPGFNKQGCKDFYWVMGDVIRYFEKDHKALRTRWEQYSMKYLAVYENVQLRIENGFEIKPDEQKKLIDNARAIAQPINSILSDPNANLPLPTPLTSLPAQNNLNTEENLIEVEPSHSEQSIDCSESVPDGAENPQAYKQMTDLEEASAHFRALAESRRKRLEEGQEQKKQREIEAKAKIKRKLTQLLSQMRNAPDSQKLERMAALGINDDDLEF